MRLQVNISDELADRIDFYARKMGVSRSALCSVVLGEYVHSMDKSFDLADFIKEYQDTSYKDTAGWKLMQQEERNKKFLNEHK